VSKVLTSILAGSTLYLALVTNIPASAFDDIANNSNVGVVAELEVAYRTNNGDIQKTELQIQPELQVALLNDLKLTTLLRFRADANADINPSNQSKTELREFYLDSNWNEAFLTIGKQQIVWGKADGLKVLDIVNPQDFQEFILDDFDDSRIPLWILNAEIPFDETVLQLLFIPDQTYDKFTEPDGLYRFTSPLVSPSIPTGTAVVLEDVKIPDKVFQDADMAARISSFLNGWDITFNYIYHYYDVPVFFRDIDLSMASPVVTLKPEYKRSHLLGSSFSNSFGSLTFRGEVAYSLDRYYSISDVSDKDGVFQSSEFAYVAGFDWQGIEDHFLSFQLFQTYVVHDNPYLIRDQLNTTLSFLYRQTLYNETLMLELLLLHNLNDDDGLLRPKIRYQWYDDINVWAGFDIFYGESNGLFGQFDDVDRFVAGIEWSR